MLAKSRLRTTVFAVLGTGVGAMGGALVVMFSGLVNVAADEQHGALVHWVLTTTRKYAVRAAAADISVPHLSDSALVARGAGSYGQMCSTCHGAPGLNPSVVGLGLNPAPPRLRMLGFSRREDAAATFWVVKHGIRMTGMPAFGKTHSDAQLWELVAFLQKSSAVTAHEYRAMLAERSVGMARAAGTPDDQSISGGRSAARQPTTPLPVPTSSAANTGGAPGSSALPGSSPGSLVPKPAASAQVRPPGAHVTAPDGHNHRHD